MTDIPATVIFDTATLNDAVSKAARVSPTKGEAFDKAAGVEISTYQAKRTARVRSTNLSVTYESEIPMLEGNGPEKVWRLPSQTLSSLLATLPMGDGSTVEMIDQEVDTALRIRSGRTVVKINMYEGKLEDPIFKWEPLSDLLVAHDLASKVEQVAWATDPKSTILQGVHITGEHLYATDTQVMAMVPVKIGLAAPITVPLSTLIPLLSSSSDCRMGSSERRCLLMLDDHSRATSALLEGKYPDVRRAMREDFTGSMKIHRQQFADTLDRLMILARQDKLPALTLNLDAGGLVSVLTLDINVPGKHRMQDSIDVETDFDDAWTAAFTPAKILNALSHARSDYVHFDFGHENPAKTSLSLIRLRDEKDYVSYIMPRKV